MAAIDKCIIGKGETGVINKRKAEAAAEQYQEAVSSAMEEGRLSQPEAERVVAARMIDSAEREIARKKRMALTQVRIQTDIRALGAQAEQNNVGVDIAMEARLSTDPRERVQTAALDKRIQDVRAEADKTMVDFLAKFRTKTAGLRQNLTDLDDVVREQFGESTGNASAKELAGGLGEALERLRTRFNAAGGDVVERKDWGFFQSHDQALVAKASEDDWVNFVIDRVDPERMLDVNGLPMTRKQMSVALRESYRSISTGGLYDLNSPAVHRGFGSSVNRRANSRFIVFRDADAWIEYHKSFGKGNLYDHITSSTHAMARDVATLEVLGPYPEATLRFMEGLVDEAAAKGAISETGKKAASLARRIGAPNTALQNLYNTVSGKIAIPVKDGSIASISQGNRNLVVAATLGGAFFSALADVPLVAITARMNGMSITKTLARHLSSFVANSDADRKLAIRLQFGAQGWASKAIGAQRIMGEVTGPEITERISDTVLRASFLSPWTESARYAFQIEMLAHITGSASKTFDQLDDALKGSFQRHGITPEDWDVIRNTPKWVDPDSGADFIRAEDVSGGALAGPGFDASNKLQQAIFTETDFAVVTATPRVRSLLTAGAPAGTFWGEVMRNTALFKGFPVSMIHQHYSRLMARRGLQAKGQYAAWLVLGMTTMGALGEQLTGLSKGRDVEDMSNPEFWSRAAMRGGSMGLFGDIVLADQNRWGGGIFDSLLGPVAGQIEDVSKMSVGNVQELIAGDRTNAGRELSRFIQKNTPGQSLWYSRLAMERIVFDELDYILDPRASQAFRDVERKARKERDQTYFWRPGRRAPEGPPQIP